MRCGLACVVAVLIFSPAAGATPPLVSVEATPLTGQAPLKVAFTATGDAAAYHWDFGDGASLDGRVVEHTYAAGRWSATLTARSGDGESTTQAVSVTAYGIALAAPAIVRYARRTVLRGTLVPAERGVRVALVGPNGPVARGRTTAKGTYALRARLRTPGPYFVESDRASSSPVEVRVVPRLVTRLVGSGARGSRYVFTARLVPAAAGTIAVRLMRRSDVLLDRTFERHVQLALDTRRLTTYRIRVEVVPTGLYAGTVRVVRASVVLPRLSYGSRSVAVAQLGDRLRQLHYAAPYGTSFDSRMLDGVYAFQKVQNLPRTGVADARVWQALSNAGTPLPRYASPADHLEVNKGRQVLYVVRRARVVLIVPISTAGLPGTYTPAGRFAIYRKVAGFDPSPLGTLFDPMYFIGGYAIHGNPSVPPYPASHGCVRVPMWVAPHLYATNWYGEAVYVY